MVRPTHVRIRYSECHSSFTVFIEEQSRVRPVVHAEVVYTAGHSKRPPALALPSTVANCEDVLFRAAKILYSTRVAITGEPLRRAAERRAKCRAPACAIARDEEFLPYVAGRGFTPTAHIQPFPRSSLSRISVNPALEMISSCSAKVRLAMPEKCARRSAYFACLPPL